VAKHPGQNLQHLDTRFADGDAVTATPSAWADRSHRTNQERYFGRPALSKWRW
jgi:hypothetical protein